MKVQYRFVNGDLVDVEVPQEYGEALADLDRREHNNNQTQTRRHVSLDMMVQDQGVQFVSAESDAFEQIYSSEMPEHLLKGLSAAQRALLQRVFVAGESMADIARADGVNRSSVHRRIERIFAQIKKNL